MVPKAKEAAQIPSAEHPWRNKLHVLPDCGESAMKKTEGSNTLAFTVDGKAIEQRSNGL